MRWRILIGLCGLCACGSPRGGDANVLVTDTLMQTDSARAFSDSFRPDGTRQHDTALVKDAHGIDTRGVDPNALVAYAKTLIGTPYVYGSTDPKVGFDCSGFITYVFNHYDVKVPRSSVEFTTVGTTVDTLEARAGDLILFTGTNPAEREVGHMGIIVGRDAEGLQFIHSTSGKQHGVTITALGDYYKTRFVRIGRVF